MRKLHSSSASGHRSFCMLTAVSAVALMAGIAAASTAEAQQNTQQNASGANTSAGEATVLEEVTVTARKVSENLQESPVSVTAFSEEEMASRDARTLADIASIAPNVNFGIGGDAAGSNSNAVVYIRGIGQKDFSPTVDPGVGIYIDGVYLSRTIGGVLDIADAAQVEVLRGPQGTVFGRNSLGGAVLLTTRDPGAEFEGRIRATYGQLNRADIMGTVDIPFSDTLSASFTGLYKHRDGFVRTINNQDLNDVDSKGGRIKLVWTPTDRLKFTLSADGDWQNKHGGGEVSVDIPLGGITNGPFNRNDLLTLKDPQGNPHPIEGARHPDGSPDNACAVNGGPLNDPDCVNDQYVLGPFRSAETAPRFDNLVAWGVAGTAEYQLADNLALKSITAYRELHDDFTRAEDGTPFPLLFNLNELTDTQFSQEVQAISSFFGDRLQTVSGLYYFGEVGSNHQFIQFFRNDIIPNHLGGRVQAWNVAAYSESTLKLTDRWRVIAGVRFTHERKKFRSISFRADSPLFDLNAPTFPSRPNDPNFLFIAQNSGAAFPPAAFSPEFDMNFLSGNAAQPAVIVTNQPSWRVGTQYDVTDRMMAFFTVSRGFKSGGFDIRVTSPAKDALPSFGPEFVTDYEVGLKAEFPEINLRANTTLFWMNYSNIQLVGVRPGTINTVTFNGGDGRIRGVEEEVLFEPIRDLIIDGTFGYQNAEFTSILPGVFVTKEDKFVRTPEFSANVSVSYDFHMAKYGDLTTRIAADYKSSEEFQVQNVSVNERFVRADPRLVLNASATYLLPNRDDIAITFGVNNLTDKVYAEQGDGNTGLGLNLVGFAQPRNWYLTVQETF